MLCSRDASRSNFLQEPATDGGATDEPPRIGFVFSGVGDHYSGMGEGLAQASPCYAATLKNLGGAPAQTASAPPTAGNGFAVDLRMMLAARPASDAGDLDAIHLDVLRVHLALTAALAAEGVRPAVVFGISLGQV